MKRQIPNILSVLRLFMIPLFVVFYFKDSEAPAVYYTAGIYILAWTTDILDGFLARHNGWITEAGKILDPVADKLMQLTVAICFTVDNRIFLFLLVPTVIKELAIIIGALIIIKKQKSVEPSHWYGKAASAALFLCSVIRIVFRGNDTLDIVLCTVMVTVMLFALVMYYIKDFRGKYVLKRRD